MARSTRATRSGTSSSEPDCPDAGDVVWIDLSPVRGHEQDGHRPALVLSARSYNRAARLCLACAMTTKMKGYPFEVAFADGSVVLADQVRTLAWPARNASFKERATPKVLAEVRAKLRALVGS